MAENDCNYNDAHRPCGSGAASAISDFANHRKDCFPDFLLLLVEGFMHTHDVIRYMTRIGLFALISEIPFDLLFYGRILDGTHQNVFFTLFIGLVMLYYLTKRYPAVLNF